MARALTSGALGGEGVFDLPDRVLTGDRVVVLGAEGRGLRRGIEQVLDHRVRIPMEGRIDSLNVSSAAAVLLFSMQVAAVLSGARGANGTAASDAAHTL